MTASRRNVVRFGTAALAGAALTASDRSTAASAGKPAFVLVHGAWHGAWCYAKLIPELAALGHSAVAVDLPGHGLSAQYPASWFARPLDRAAYANEVSPLAAVTVQECVDSVLAAIDQLRAGGHEHVILVGHSLGGVTITGAAESAPGKLQKLVYLSAFMLADGQRSSEVVAWPEAATAKVRSLVLANPATISATRIDPASTDVAYRATLKAAFFGDLDEVQFRAAAELLTPDEPAAMGVTPTVKSVARWGSVPRHYISCLQDQAIPVALQRRFIEAADAFVPVNKTVVHQMNTSHSPFLSAPKELALLLARIAGA